jgi:dihydrofolate synthase/folylpolyglutamate synthase
MAMTFEQALHFWYGRVNFEQRSPKPSDLKLDRMRTLLELLGNPQDRLRIVHVAGSKGKGSTSAMLAAVLRRAGYRTGLFTSPHLCRVEERIQVDGVPITPDELAAVLADIAPVVARMDGRRPAGEEAVTFFEVATALGFLHLVRRRVEAAVIEVGLGGRFDSTNVCDPLLAILTSISFDHTQQLGNTLASIAFEKAGIVKPGRPALSGARDPEARAVIERVCRARGAPLRQLDADVRYRYEPGHVTAEAQRAPRVVVTTPERAWPPLELALLGEHQAANAALVVAAVEQLRRAGLHVPDAAVAAGLAGVTWPARLEVVRRAPLVLLDCAHNVASAQALVDTLRTTFPAAFAAGARRHLVFAGSSDKDLRGILAVLAPHFTHAHLTRYTNNPRAVAGATLADYWRQAVAVEPAVYATAADAWHAAEAAAQAADLICVTGSVFLAGELRPTLVTNS